MIDNCFLGGRSGARYTLTSHRAASAPAATAAAEVPAPSAAASVPRFTHHKTCGARDIVTIGLPVAVPLSVSERCTCRAHGRQQCIMYKCTTWCGVSAFSHS